MHCQDKLELYLLEALEPKESFEVREHLSTCDSCASEMKRLETLVGALHQVRTVYESGGGVSIQRVRSFRSWKPWAAAAAILAAAIPAVFWSLPETGPTPAPPPSIVSKPETPASEKKPHVVSVDEETHMTLSPEAVYEISNDRRVLTLTEGTLDCEIGGASFTLNLPNGRVVGKAYKISAKVEKDKVTVRVHHGTVLFMDGKGGRHILSGSRAYVQTVNGVTRVGAIGVSEK